MGRGWLPEGMLRRSGLAVLVAGAVVGCGSGSSGQPGSDQGQSGVSAGPSLTPDPGASPSGGSGGHASPRATGGARSSPPAVHSLAPASGQASATGHITVTTPSAGTFTTTQSDCGTSSSYAFFHFGVSGSGEESRIDISAGWQGPGTYGPGTFGVSASVVHASQAWLVDFQHSSDATLTVDAGSRSGRISFTSQNGRKEAVSAVFTC
jgi:hypothetical protein